MEFSTPIVEYIHIFYLSTDKTKICTQQRAFLLNFGRRMQIFNHNKHKSKSFNKESTQPISLFFCFESF